jgi:hypothetical protein
MVEYAMDNPLVTKAIYGYYNNITLRNHPLWNALKKDKTKFILLRKNKKHCRMVKLKNSIMRLYVVPISSRLKRLLSVAILS